MDQALFPFSQVLQLSMYLVSLFLCLLTLVTFLRFANIKQHLVAAAAKLLLLFIAMQLCESLMSLRLFPTIALLMLMILSFFMAPVCLSVLKVITPDTSHSVSKSSWRLLVIGICLLSPLASVIIFHQFNQEPVSASYSMLIHTSMVLAIVVYLMQNTLILKMCYRQLGLREKQNRQLFASSHEAGHQLLQVLIFALVISAVINTFRLLYSAFFNDIIEINLSVAMVQTLCIFTVCYLLARLQSKRFQSDQEVRLRLFEQSPPKKYAKSPLSKERRDSIEQRIRDLFDRENVFVNPDFNLSQLADILDVNSRVLSQVISGSELNSFHHMVNQRRVELAQEVLLASPSKNILEIAFECGFNSKSTFNLSFKKRVGVTPSRYRQEASIKEAQVSIE